MCLTYFVTFPQHILDSIISPLVQSVLNFFLFIAKIFSSGKVPLNMKMGKSPYKEGFPQISRIWLDLLIVLGKHKFRLFRYKMMIHIAYLMLDYLSLIFCSPSPVMY